MAIFFLFIYFITTQKYRKKKAKGIKITILANAMSV